MVLLPRIELEIQSYQDYVMPFNYKSINNILQEPIMRAAEIMRKFMKAVEEDPTTDIANLTAPTSSPKPPPTNATTPPAPGDLTFGKGKMNIATGDTSNITIGKAPAPTLPAGAYFNMGKPTDSSGQWSAGVGVGKAKELPGTSDPKFSINFNKKF